MSERDAKCLAVLKGQCDQIAPHRSHDSDGTLASAQHHQANPSSDHEPWVKDGDVGVVTAIDITHDPAGGLDAYKLAEWARTHPDGRYKYIISNRKIANFAQIGDCPPWKWRPYNGSNPHDHHTHFSMRPIKSLYDSTDKFNLDGLATGQTPPPEQPEGPLVRPPGVSREAILALAADSDIANYEWKDRGRAPIGFTKGMALSFATILKLYYGDNAIVVEAAKANTGDDSKDFLSWQNSRFVAAHRSNNVAGEEVLINLFAGMMGLAMRETSGEYPEGWDRETSRDQLNANSAEAGLFQMSWNAHDTCPSIATLLQAWKMRDGDLASLGFQDVFGEGVHPTSKQLENFGSGDGLEFQKMSKTAPLFAVQCALIALRQIGGRMGHWGPIRRRENELPAAAFRLFQAVRDLVAAVRYVQLALNKLGATPQLDTDGDYGPKTAAMIERFQQENNLSPTGHADPQTLDEIERHVIKLQSGAEVAVQAPAAPGAGPPTVPVPLPSPDTVGTAPMATPHTLAGEVRNIFHHVFG